MAKDVPRKGIASIDKLKRAFASQQAPLLEHHAANHLSEEDSGLSQSVQQTVMPRGYRTFRMKRINFTSSDLRSLPRNSRNSASRFWGSVGSKGFFFDNRRR